jgi:ATP-dependent helicase HepA
MDREEILFECVFIPEAVAPESLETGRFFNPEPLRILISHTRADRTEEYPFEELTAALLEPDDDELKDIRGILDRYASEAIEDADRKAKEILLKRINEGLESLNRFYETEIERLQSLRKINDHIREDEVTDLKQALELSARHIRNAGVRLDAVRVIWKV